MGMAAVSAGIACRARGADLGDDWFSAIKELEQRSGGRLGVALYAGGRQIDYRGDERFSMCSTFKILAAANTLVRVDAKQESLDRIVAFSADELVSYSPMTSKAVDHRMSVEGICAAAITRSDNTAGNLLLREGGGTTGLTAFARKIGDPVTRLDRTEPTLNEAAVGDVRDTTSPNAMLRNLRALILGNLLSQSSRQMLSSWLVGNRTGDHRLRAGLPIEWLVGDKTATGDNGTYNHVAIVWPPYASPAIITVYLTRATTDAPAADALIASIARASVGRLMQR
jgi:beta-lactamase class A